MEQVATPTYLVILVLWDHKENPNPHEIDLAIQLIARDADGASARVSSCDTDGDQIALAISDRLLSRDHAHWIRTHWDTGEDVRAGRQFRVPITVPAAPPVKRDRRR